MVVDYKPNSHASKAKGAVETKPEERKVEKVVSGKVKVKKKNELQKFAGYVISEEAGNVGSYILMDVLLPTIKRTVVDMITDSVEMIFLGETRSRRDRRDKKDSYTPYRSYSSDRRDRDRYDGGSRQSRFDYDELIFDSRGEAEKMLNKMDDVIDRYGFVTIADMYDMADVPGAPYTSAKYGWMNLRRSEVVRVRDGYVIKLPRAVPID